MTYGGSHARGQPTSQPQALGIQATSAAYIAVHGNAGFLTYRTRPGIEPTPSWILAGFVTAEPQQDIQSHLKGAKKPLKDRDYLGQICVFRKRNLARPWRMALRIKSKEATTAVYTKDKIDITRQ